MSIRMLTDITLTKPKRLCLVLIIALALSCTYRYSVNNIHAKQTQYENTLKICTTLKSELPLSHSNHPCNAVYRPNKSWWAWFSGESKSTHRQFLDLIELVHYSFD